MLNEKQQKCIKSMVIENKTQKQIASEIQVSEQTICEWKKSKEFKDELQNEVREYFGILAIKAQKALNMLLESDNEYIKLQTIKDVLDRAGYKPIERQLTGNANISYTSNNYEEFIKNIQGEEF